MHDQLRHQFQAGTADFRPIPFWFWNNDLSETSILSSLNELFAKGIREVLIHPRTGMSVDYFSDLFWERVSFAVKEAAARGMKVWLYDEFNWPSGAVGGQLLAAHPQYMMRLLNVESLTVAFQQEVTIPFPGQFLAAFLLDEENGTYRPLEGNVLPRVEGAPETDFRPASEAFFPGQNAAEIAVFGGQPDNLYRQQFVTTTPPGRILVFSVEMNRTSWAHTTHQHTPLQAGFIDKLNPEAVQTFINMTHEAYYERLGEYFGTTIVGIFTDEPAAWAFPNHFDFFAPVRQSSFVWSQHLLERFQERYGYTLVEHLPELVFDAPAAKKTRHAFWQLANEMYREAYFQPIARWCEEKGIAFTGHLNMEETPETLIRYETGIFNNLRDMQIPGYDFLAQQPGYKFPVLNFSAKLVSSIAHALGRERVMCEIFGASGWQTSLADCRKTLNWIMATGISLLSTHGHFLSIQGMRKRDYPPSHSPHEPWWRYYEQFSQYCNRTGLLTTYGAYQGDIAILYSFGNQWMRYSLDQQQRDPRQEEHQRFVSLIIAFLRHQHDFDFVFDEQWKEGLLEIRDGQLIAPGATYRLLVIPPVESLPLQVASAIVAYARSGGRVVLIGSWPVTSEEQVNDPRMIALGQELLLFSETQVQCIAPIDEWPRVVQQVIDLLERTHPLPARIVADQREDCIMMHRQGSDYELVYIANVGEHRLQGSIELLKDGAWEMWNPENGEQYRIPLPPQGACPQAVDLVLYAGEVRCFVRPVTAQTVQEPLTPALLKSGLENRQRIVDLSEGWTVRPLRGNMYAPDTWEARLVENGSDWTPFPVTRDFWPKPQLVREVMIPGALCQFKTSFTWEGTSIPTDLQLVLEQERDLRVWLNEQELERSELKEWLWDESNIAYGLTARVRPGLNHLLIEQRWPDYLGGFHPPYATLEPVVIYGSFRFSEGKLRVLSSEIASGSWHTQGFPHYIGFMEYHHLFHIEEVRPQPQSYTLTFEALRETAEVWVNGVRVGVRAWGPFEFDLSGLLHGGENEIRVLISNTAANLLQPDNAQPCGLLGKAGLYLSSGRQ
ncbi:glycosyl hydrolase [Tengunoibacter tsumagoiensis]|uniref:Uncharacterized protein n=1 Tax=Tengunoibacter tsumagoiensis TaxID=2014871 RepID=A0A402A3Q5_9CHLR|nr:glycosyl hydrolase [Tengunoibacter tsumagoiensis]GCE13676.1 hypothetical protein KTT_35350 [Tengunoibacter tsumagoiensis]